MAVRTRRERSEATTGELVEVARRLFAADGYAATSLDDVVRGAGVTKGALYHHVTGKRAPSVLGWETMREVEGRYALVQLHQGIEALIGDGHLAPRPVAPLATLLFGAMCEGAMMAVRAADPPATTRQVLAELRTIMEALRA